MQTKQSRPVPPLSSSVRRQESSALNIPEEDPGQSKTHPNLAPTDMPEPNQPTLFTLLCLVFAAERWRLWLNLHHSLSPSPWHSVVCSYGPSITHHDIFPCTCTVDCFPKFLLCFLSQRYQTDPLMKDTNLTLQSKGSFYQMTKAKEGSPWLQIKQAVTVPMLETGVLDFSQVT